MLVERVQVGGIQKENSVVIANQSKMLLPNILDISM